jgi:hypothetical protein
MHYTCNPTEMIWKTSCYGLGRLPCCAPGRIVGKPHECRWFDGTVTISSQTVLPCHATFARSIRRQWRQALLPEDGAIYPVPSADSADPPARA